MPAVGYIVLKWGILGLVAVPRQHVERRERCAVRIETDIEQIAIEISAMLAAPGVRVDDAAGLIALIWLVPVNHDAMCQGQRGLKAGPLLSWGHRQGPQVLLEGIHPSHDGPAGAPLGARSGLRL